MSLTEKIKDSVDSLGQEIRELKDQVSGLLRRNKKDDSALETAGSSPLARWTWPGWPHVDIQESDDAFRVTVDLPGLKRSDVDVQVERQALILSVRHEESRQQQEGGWVHRERVSGTFVRTLSLPSPVDPESAKARMRSGVLTLELRKLESARNAHRIRIA